MTDIYFAEKDDEIERCFPVMAQLRPHLDPAEFVERVRRQMARDGYRLVMLEDRGEVLAVAGFRTGEMLARGRFMYVDDIVVDEDHRSDGYGVALLNWIADHARSLGCKRLDLDSSTDRTDAHRFYESCGLTQNALHFALEIKPEQRAL